MDRRPEEVEEKRAVGSRGRLAFRPALVSRWSAQHELISTVGSWACSDPSRTWSAPSRSCPDLGTWQAPNENLLIRCIHESQRLDAGWLILCSSLTAFQFAVLNVNFHSQQVKTK